MRTQSKIMVSAAVALLLFSSALASPEAMSLHTKWQALRSEATCKAKCVTAKFWNKEAMEQSKQCKAACDDQYKVNIGDNCGKALINLMKKGDKTSDDQMALAEFGVDGNAPLSLYDFEGLKTIFQGCMNNCFTRDDFTDCQQECYADWNKNVAAQDGTSLVSLDQEKVLAAFQDPIALHTYVYANKVYWSCRWDCKNGKDCSKEHCTKEYNKNLADGCGASMTKAGTQLVSLLTTTPDNVNEETLQTFGLTEEAPLSLHSYLKANSDYYKCKAKCFTKWCNDQCWSSYYKNLYDGNKKHLLSVAYVDEGLETVSLIQQDDAPLSLHSYTIANKDYWSCRWACRGDSLCKSKCTGEYNNNIADGCGKSVTSKGTPQQAQVALHSWIEANAAWAACKVKCTGKSDATQCRAKCNDDYNANRADGKALFDNLDTIMSANSESLASIEGIDQTLATFGLDQESPISLSSWAYDQAAKANCKRKCKWSDQACWDNCDAEYKAERARDNNKVSMISSEDFLDLYNMDIESPVSLHSWTNANYLWAKCKASCPFQILTSKKQCSIDCNNQYYAQRNDGCEKKQAVVLASTVEAPVQQDSSLLTFVAALLVLISAVGVASALIKKNRKGEIVTGSYVQDKATISEKLMKEEDFAVLP